MTYQEWAEQYDTSATILQGSINKLKKQLKNAPAAVLQELRYRISVLQVMYRECVSTADTLRKRKGDI